MRVFVSVLAVVIGFVTMAILVTVGTGVASRRLLPPEPPGGPQAVNRAYLTANLSLSFVAAVIGGYVCAWIGSRAPIGHVACLAGLMAIMSIVSAATTRPGTGQPTWYPWLIAVIGVTGVVAGGALRIALLSRPA